MERGITHVFICGLALDYCVGCTACDVAELGFRVFVIDDLCRSVSPKSEAEMRASFASEVGSLHLRPLCTHARVRMRVSEV